MAMGINSHAEGGSSATRDSVFNTGDDIRIYNIGGEYGAISESSHVEGYNTVAGQMGYYIYSIDFSNIDAPVVVLSKTREAPPIEGFNLRLYDSDNLPVDSVAKNEYRVGDLVTIVNDNVFGNCATITAINKNKLTLTKLPFAEFAKTGTESYIKNYTLCVNAKPRIGATDIGNQAHAEGLNTRAQHFAAHAEGDGCIVTGKASHAEGHGAKAYGPSAHAENWGSEAHGANSHAGGSNCKSIGNSSFAHGQNSQANGVSSFVFGVGLIASGDYQTVVGQYNSPVPDALFIVGCGTSASSPANALVVYKDGSTWIKSQR
jgi:hypothetical protein